MARIRIAVFISALYEDMVRETLEGMLHAAKGHDVKLLFFTSFADNHTSRDYERYRDYDTGDYAVYLLPDLKDFDALISMDTYMTGTLIAPIDELKRTAPCPVVTMGTVKEGTWNIFNDQPRSFAELIGHITDVHGCRDIVYVSGQIERSFCRERINIWRKQMTSRGLPCGDERIFYGTLRPECGEEVVAAMTARRRTEGKPDLPEAILCVNDYTAIGVLAALKDRGIRVPEDVLVTGYDDIPAARFSEPSLTTSAQPFFRVGAAGMETALALLRGEERPWETGVPGLLRLRRSCGCGKEESGGQDEIRERYIEKVAGLEALALSSTNMVLGVAMDQTEEEIYADIEEACTRNTGFRDAVLCLMRDWSRMKQIGSRKDLEGEVFDVVCGRWRGKKVRRQRLPEGCLLPGEMMADSEPYYIFPIHHLQYFMGYMIVRPDLAESEQLHIKSWLVSVSTVLTGWLTRSRLTETVEKLEVLYQTDMLTGLYNRYGYYRLFESYYGECRAARTELAVFVIDMNRMKDINDGYGHAEGDSCLKTIADAMKESAGPDDVCIRTGGDEFVVLAKNYDGEKEAAFVRGLRERIAEKTERDRKDYRITVSVGCCRAVPPEEEVSVRSEAERYLTAADHAMYREKRRAEAGNQAG